MANKRDLPFRDKIRSLFEYRGIPDFIEKGGISDSSFEDHLYSLQASIYKLDNYLEKEWTLEQSVLDEFWRVMENELSWFVPNAKKHDSYLYQIKVYLSREVGLRKGDFALHISLDHFYYYKSCDVRLMRRLIYEHSQVNRSQLHPRNWLIYDYVTEVNDDVEDIFEDLEIFNCNRLLLASYSNGIAQARKTFRVFLNDLRNRNAHYKGDSGIKKDTDSAIDDTLVLLDKQLNKLESVDIQSAILFSKF